MKLIIITIIIIVIVIYFMVKLVYHIIWMEEKHNIEIIVYSIW